MFENIITNIIADFIFLFISIFIGWSGFLVLRRRKLLRFFGIDESKKISIYLSNLKIIEHGSLGSDGKPGLYKGTAVVFNEALQAISLQSLFTYKIPVLNQQPGLLRYLLVADIQFILQAAPLNENEIEKDSTIITFGSPAYNIVSQLIEDNLTPIFASTKTVIVTPQNRTSIIVLCSV